MKKSGCKYFLGLLMTLVMILSILPTSIAQVDAADYSSNTVISVAEGKIGSTAYNHLCLAFVKACFQVGAMPKQVVYRLVGIKI